jgi:hypothetical protein
MGLNVHREKGEGRRVWVVILCLMILPFACTKEYSSANDTAALKVSFRLMNDGQPLNNTDEYVNRSGERYTVRTFKFYVSQIRLLAADHIATAEKESYHLVDLGVPASNDLPVMFRRGTYRSIEFLVGVDSIRNVSGAQTGALDPALGMFWTWNTGYIFAKLEGQSPVSAAPGRAMTYHIGGFRQGENALRRIVLSFPADKPVMVGRTLQLIIDADLARWFDHAHTLSIAQQPSVMTPGGVSLKIADNYAGMFSIFNVIDR